MQMTPYKNPWTARGRSKENKRHVRFLVPTDSARLRLKKKNFYPTNGALVCLTYVASGSVVKRSMSLFKAFSNYGSPFSTVGNMDNEEKIK
ncbi:hypothetical protein T10_7661 [Trichinella papuae]|uniref:Uncharacterized protein n=1 Tax=Trichinella papuae TaxID=268474 RepID=A0A0V1M4S0_9BILA|nr:hypothetical protein T10_7661 [Trichinella papuae]